MDKKRLGRTSRNQLNKLKAAINKLKVKAKKKKPSSEGKK